MNLLDVVQGHRRAFNSYHDHKEKSAYAATTLYVAAVSWWAVSERFWTLATPVTLVISVAIALASAAIVSLFVSWQLRNRLAAATVEAACINLEAKIVSGEINPDDSWITVRGAGTSFQRPLLTKSKPRDLDNGKTSWSMWV